jgi:hypothetical protein
MGMTIPYGDPTRHRVLLITGTDIHGDTYQIAGWYEPICGYDRSQGAAAIFKNGALEAFIQPIWDDTIGTHLARRAARMRIPAWWHKHFISSASWSSVSDQRSAYPSH